ncbi:lipase family protein [Xanthomonas albilineans]|uniref:lipase family protein n=2 Tax=Xanthomonas albilineans TaxID=29447 RepID=UPI0005F30A68|nr:hypothetical protein [Xanthomonas albilineans]PPU92034.1 hypothetical protein XalbCFBP2523_12330 [Xanthomonas albilineans]
MRYDPYQTVFALSTLASWISNQIGTAQALQADYQKVLMATLASPPVPQTIGVWELAWGPQVWQAENSNRSDNAMCVVKTRNLGDIAGDVYVVVITATNAFSLYDWVVEDFDVAKVVDFSTYDPTASTAPVRLLHPSQTNPVISMGTALGVWHLLNMVSPPSGVSPGDTLDGFLKKVTSSGASVIFAGHSLGGALSPTMATWFKNAHRLDECTAVYCYPTAGPTPGNAAFAQLCTRVLPPTSGNGYRVWNRVLWNAYDVVPHGWDLAMLEQIKTLYANAPMLLINAIVDIAKQYASSSGIAYCQIANQRLSGTLSGIPTTLWEFIEQAETQHTTAYAALIAHRLKPVVPPAKKRQTVEMDMEAEFYALLKRLEALGDVSTTLG